MSINIRLLMAFLIVLLALMLGVDYWLSPNSALQPFLAGSGLLILIALAWLGNKFIFHPLLRLRAGSQRLAAGDFSQLVEQAYGKEISTVVSAFNNMAGQFQALLRLQDNSIREQSMELANLVEMSQLVNSSATEREMLQQFVKSLADSAKVTWCRIAILDISATKLEVRAVHSARHLPEVQLLPTQVTEEQCPMLWRFIHSKQFGLLQRHDNLSASESALLFGYQETNVLCIPIVHKERAQGMAIFGEFRSSERDPVNDRKIALCLAMVNMIGISTELGRLFSRLQDHTEETVLGMAETVEKKSPWTAGHSKRVTSYALVIGNALGWNEKELAGLKIVGLLHDIGKIGVPSSILNKAGRLTEEEYTIVKRHPDDGAQILSKMHLFHEFIPAIRHHHEWYNGQGYPSNLRGTEIPLAARVLAVADAFDAMTADRPYRKGMPDEVAMHRLQEAIGEQFDPDIVEAFTRAYPHRQYTSASA